MPSYHRQLQLPAYGLYKEQKLVATLRANSIYEARDKFRLAGMEGDRVRRVGVEH